MSLDEGKRSPVTRQEADHLVREHTTEIADGAVPKNPKVSVCIITYDHARFISQALEGALTQQVNFPYEIIVSDDHSTDGTTQIVLDYQQQHPDKIRVLLGRENLGKYTGNGRLNFLRTLRACRGTYIALLEGDDYWTDCNKLQLQVEFMDAHPGAALCHHLVTYLDDQTGKLLHDFPPPARRIERCSADLLAEGNFIQTCSVMLRRKLIPELSDDFLRLKLGDWPLFALVGQHGWIGYLDRNLATYRLHEKSVWSSKSFSYRHTAGIDLARFLISHLRGKTQRGWMDALLRISWEGCHFAAASGPSAKFEARKRFLGSALRCKRRLPRFLLHRLRNRVGF